MLSRMEKMEEESEKRARQLQLLQLNSSNSSNSNSNSSKLRRRSSLIRGSVVRSGANSKQSRPPWELRAKRRIHVR